MVIGISADMQVPMNLPVPPVSAVNAATAAQANPALGQRHPAYLQMKTLRDKSRDLYEVLPVKEKGDKYLFKEKNETPDEYNLRLRRAVLDPWLEKIIESRQALIFAKEPVRLLTPEMEVWRNNVDKLGTPAEVFFSRQARNAQVDGMRWVLVSVPISPEIPYANAAEEMASDHRPYFTEILPEWVVDWEVSSFDLKPLWVVLEIPSFLPRGEADFGRPLWPRLEWWVWTRTEWIRYRSTTVGTQDPLTFEYVSRGENPTGEVPLVPWYGVYRDDMIGRPVGTTILDHIILLYKESDKDWFERLSSHPIPWMSGPNPPDKLDVGRGFYMRSEQQAGTVQVGYLEPSGSAVSSHTASIQDLRSRIFSIALAESKKDSAQVQSAEGQREDRMIFASSLHSSALSYQFAEQRCWDLALAWMGMRPALALSWDSPVDIQYSNDFTAPLIDSVMVTALSGLITGNQLTLRTALDILQRGGVIPDWIDLDEETKKLEKQTSDAAAADEAAIGKQLALTKARQPTLPTGSSSGNNNQTPLATDTPGGETETGQ